jgi:hypothetical protein
MKIMKNIINHMESTMEEAEEYVSEAALFKDEYPSISRTYLRLAEEHLGHYENLHTSIVSAINEYKKIKGAPPETMKAVYDYVHERLTEEFEDLRRSIDRLKLS